MGSTAENKSDTAVVLVVILLGIAIPIIVFWVLIIWCSRRKRKRMAAFNKAAAQPDPVADDTEGPADPAAPSPSGAPAEGEPPKSGQSGMKTAVEKSTGKSAVEAKSGKSDMKSDMKSKEMTKSEGDKDE